MSQDALDTGRDAEPGGAARCGGQTTGLPERSSGGAVEARRSRVALAPSRSDAEGALDLRGTAPQAARHRRAPRANLEEQNLHTRSRSRPAPRWARAHDVMLLARIEGEQQASGKALAATAAAAGAVYRSSR